MAKSHVDLPSIVLGSFSFQFEQTIHSITSKEKHYAWKPVLGLLVVLIAHWNWSFRKMYETTMGIEQTHYLWSCCATMIAAVVLEVRMAEIETAWNPTYSETNWVDWVEDGCHLRRRRRRHGEIHGRDLDHGRGHDRVPYYHNLKDH